MKRNQNFLAKAILKSDITLCIYFFKDCCKTGKVLSIYCMKISEHLLKST